MSESEKPTFSYLLDDQLFPPGSALPLDGVEASALPFLVHWLRCQRADQPILVVTGGTRAQEAFHQDLCAWHSMDEEKNGPQPDYFPSWEVLPAEDRLPEADTLGERLKTLLHLREHPEKACIVAQVDSILQKTFSRSNFQERLREVKMGAAVDPLELLDWLEAQGYEPVNKVTQKGEFAVRGGIVDFYPLSAAWPIRLEFFGNEIDSMREFDPNTQTSQNKITQTLIPPAGEMGILKHQLESLAPGQEPESAAECLVKHLPANALIVIAEPGIVWENLNLFRSQKGSWSPIIHEWEFFIADFLKNGGRVILAGDCGVFDFRNLVGEEANLLPMHEIRIETPQTTCPMPLESTLEMADNYRLQLFKQILQWKKEGYQCSITYTNSGEDVRLKEIWGELILGRKIPPLIQAGISRGVIVPELRYALITDNDIYCRRKAHRSRRLRKTQAAASRSQLEVDFDHIEAGDLVVHLQYGIAKFHGIGKMPQGAGHKSHTFTASTDSPECLILEFGSDDPFADPPLMYVPVTAAHLVSKYIGVGRARPPLSRLGGKRWAASCAQAEKAVADVAADLLRVQAMREAEKGFEFPADTDWQHAFENAFEYEETPDQLKAIEETKRDMEGSRPMDRLVCGDVGFGKTEVAIRAAFKAVMAGKQVALLAPTTVLVQQHYNTFTERMAGYPFRIETLSRFKGRKSQEQILSRLAAGDIDIIIGTHRLVQSDIRFKDLGLFIVDEEQRFGVQQKEKIKKLKALTDVLTLTATPIPRTLYMALAGVKAMSCIETPPQERLPVKTTVCQYDERIIRDAIQRELNRQGQVFFLHNRVSTIETMERKLRELVPHARIAVGHGQMETEELEKVMASFVNGEVDILLSTTIIESGLDIPNANTIIIDRADRFGLSELYQLRGRVGRYRNQAYAYLLIPRHGALLADARKRISAIKQYSRLGSGFKIAMRDLEIRGAGNILGAEQSGHISAIGFDLYCRLLQTSIDKLKGVKPSQQIDTQVDLDFLLTEENEDKLPGGLSDSRQLIPVSYISDPVQRLEIYRRLAQAKELDTLDSISAELKDRFGKQPPRIQYLIDVHRIRVIAGKKSISAIESQQNKIIITRKGVPIMVYGRYPQFTKKTTKGRLKELLQMVQNMA